jgi:hypothetical protein
MSRAVFRIILCCCAVILLAAHAHAVIGMSRDELIRAYGPVQETAKSVYGDQFTDLLFLARSTADGNSIIIAATMFEERCHGVSYVKNDASGRPAPLTADELKNQMLASSRNAGAAWKQLAPKEWQLDAGPEVSRALKARWPKPELFQVFTDDLIRRGQVQP